MWDSNQSYTDKNVDVTVALNGVVIIDRSFHVADQHNFIEHRIQLDDGTHLGTIPLDTLASFPGSGLDYQKASWPRRPIACQTRRPSVFESGDHPQVGQVERVRAEVTAVAY